MPTNAVVNQAHVVQANSLRFFVTLAPRVLRLRGAGLDVPALAKLVMPWSLVTDYPMVLVVPIDIASYATWPWVMDHVVQRDHPIWAKVEEQWDRTGLTADWALLAFGIEPEDRRQLQEFLHLNRTVGADGSIIVEIPPIWFIDP